MNNIKERFQGCLLGLAVGDALGGRFEGMDKDWIAKRYSSPQQLIQNPPTENLYYTDDTQMMIGVAEALCEDREITEQTLCRKFVDNYMPSRGYGRGARRILEAMEDGKDYRSVAANYFSGGSYGNGAAMRVAPVGLLFYSDIEKVIAQSRLSALPTHTHELGIEGAQLLAAAIAILCNMNEWNAENFYDKLMPYCQSTEFKSQLDKAYMAKDCEDLLAIGNAITALDSVPTAIASFTLSPHCFATTIGNVILNGGDTDTIAAMAGALSGVFLGKNAIPTNLLSALEKEGKGGAYIENLALKLYELLSSVGI